MCDAIVKDPMNAKPYIQGFTIYGRKPCSRKVVETIGPLGLCKVHARLAREGLIDEQGHVASDADIQAVRKYPKKFPNGLYNWVRKLEG